MASRPRRPRRADHGSQASAPSCSLRTRALGRLSAQPSSDAHLPRDPDSAAGRRLRKPVPDREGRRRRVHGGGSGARHAARGAGRRGDRERAPVRVGDALAAADGIAERDRQRSALRDRVAAPPGFDCPPAARARPRTARDDRAAATGSRSPHPRRGRRPGREHAGYDRFEYELEVRTRPGAASQRADRLDGRRSRDRAGGGDARWAAARPCSCPCCCANARSA